MYKDIFEFQEKNKTKEEQMKALSTMSKQEAEKLIAICGTPQGKLEYTKMYENSKEAL